MASYSDNVFLLQSITATGITRSNSWDISKRSQIAVQAIAETISSGNATFELQLSNDGARWIGNTVMQDVQSTNMTVGIVNKNLAANTTAGMVFINNAGWRYIRGVVNVVTDGSYSMILEAAG